MKFDGFEPWHSEDIKGIVAPKIGLKSFGLLRNRPLVSKISLGCQDECLNSETSQEQNEDFCFHISLCIFYLKTTKLMLARVLISLHIL